MTTRPDISGGRRVRSVAGACAAAMLALGAPAAQAGFFGGPFVLFDTELTSLELSGGPFPMPLASDPGNALGDSVDGYGFVDSLVTVTLSSQRDPGPGPASTGQACARPAGIVPAGAPTVGELPCFGDPPPIDPAEFDGQTFFVDSFFDVFFDITVTDVDDRPGRDYAGQPDGAMIMLPDNGPASMQSFYEAVFDANAPNFGLVPPPEVSPYIGHFTIEIPLGGDINGNGENDKIKFTLATHSVGDTNRTFICDATGTNCLDQFDSAAVLEGAVVDESTDPAFTIGGFLPNGLPDPALFGGPTTATSSLVNPLNVPEPQTVALLGLALAGLAGLRRRRAA